MRKISKQYFNISGGHSIGNKMKVELYYSLGGFSYFTYKDNARGIYLSVTPVNQGDGVESFMAFTGYKYLVKPLQRWNKKLYDFTVDNKVIINAIKQVAMKNDIPVESVDLSVLD